MSDAPGGHLSSNDPAPRLGLTITPLSRGDTEHALIDRPPPSAAAQTVTQTVRASGLVLRRWPGIALAALVV